METGLAANVSGGLSATVDPCLYSLFATVRAGQTPDAVEKALDGRSSASRMSLVTDAELAKGLKRARALFAFGAERHPRGYWLGATEIYDTYQWFGNYLDRLAGVTTTADVQRVKLNSTWRAPAHHRPLHPHPDLRTARPPRAVFEDED